MLILEGPCSEAEAVALAAHLMTDVNAKHYGIRLRAGELTAWRAALPGPQDLGELSTLFTVLGSEDGARHSGGLTGHVRFRVRDALRQWRQSRGDERSLEKLETYVLDAQAGQILVQWLTAVEWDEPVIVDGNKRAIAIHAAARESDFPLLMFVLRESG